MFRWIPYTFIRISLFFIGGIMLGIYQPDLINLSLASWALPGLILLYLVFFILSRVHKNIFFNPGLIALPAVFLAGYVHVLYQMQWRNAYHFISERKPVTYYTAVINRYTEEKESSWKTEAEVRKVFTGTWQDKTGKVVLYFSKDDFKDPYRYGDVLLIKGSPELVAPPSNPGEFDYRRYLAFRNICHQDFLYAGTVRWLENDPPSVFMKYAMQARVWAGRTIKKFVAGKREQAVASALVLGVTDGLDNELLNAYAATGSMHVLAVSGLHISIIYMMVLWLMKPLLRLKSGSWILAVVSLALLWTYAFITGLSPSVLRAVTMFSFIAVARPAGQRTNIYNTLAVSAFCLLIFDPFLLMSVGFQLSYLAVLGIVYLQPSLYRLWEPRSRFLDEVWKITSVSIAAQVATFSLGLLYFHQFPNYFLLSNLLVIPGSSLVLIAGIGVLAISFIPSAAVILGFLLTWLIKALNWVVFTVEAFPFSLAEDIHITLFQCWLLMAIVVTVILLLERKHFHYCLAAFSLVMFFSFLQWEHFRKDINVSRLTIYNVHGHTAIDFIDRGYAYFLADTALWQDRGQVSFHIRPNRLASGVSRIFPAAPQAFVRNFKGGRLVIWKKEVIVVIDKTDYILPEKIHPDMLVISNNAIKDTGSISGIADHTKIILDSSNSYFYTERILKQLRREKCDVYSVAHQGAFNLIIS